MSRLSLLSEREFGLTLARPCSPTSKGSVEGLFHVPEDIFKGLPGWIGGRRDNKTSANKGKVVAPYSKRLDQLAADILACVGIYNSRAHSAGSRIAGLSPKEVYEIKAAATGFRPRHFSEEAFDLTFSKADSKIVRQSAVTIENRTFHGNYLHEVMTGEKMEVQVPLRKGMDHAWINGPGKQPQLIKAAPRFACGDRTGAVYQSGLEAMSNAAVKALGKNIDPSVSTFENQKRAADMSPPQVAGSEVWETRTIKKTGQRKDDATAHVIPAEYLENLDAYLGMPTPVRRHRRRWNRHRCHSTQAKPAQ